MKTYKQRARVLLEDYALYMQDPAEFKGRGRVTGGKKSEKKGPRREAPPATTFEDTARMTWNTFRLPNGKEFRYSPPEEFTIEDLRRVIYHLLPGTIDFDPGKPSGGFSTGGIVRAE